MVAGYNVMTDAQKVRARIGYVPQLLSADGSLTGYENLLLSARLYLVPRAERENRIGEALDMTGPCLITQATLPKPIQAGCSGDWRSRKAPFTGPRS